MSKNGDSIISKLTFSGHESFQCRQLWLKKGFDLINSGKSFNDQDAVVTLGVGKNMVSSIRYWMKAFGLLTTNDELTTFAVKLLSDDGWDPFLEDEASLWLLHYQLIKNKLASTYALVFNELRREKIEFTKENFISFVKRKAESIGMLQINEKTLHDDFNVLVKMYIRSDSQIKDREDSFSGLLTELDLIKSFNRGKDEYYYIESAERPQIPDEVILFGILDKDGFDLSVNLNNLEQDQDSVGSVFALSKAGLLSKIENLTKKPANKIVFNDHAGVKELQFREKSSALKVLDRYYNAN